MGLSHTILLIIDSLLPMADLSCDPVPGVLKTNRRLLAGYLIHRDDPETLSVVYCELQAPVGPRASLVIYENEACKSFSAASKSRLRAHGTMARTEV